jgi:hypothetical protein
MHSKNETPNAFGDGLDHLADDGARSAVADKHEVGQVLRHDEVHDRLGRFGVGDVFGDAFAVPGHRGAVGSVAEVLQVFDDRPPRRAVVAPP